MEHARIEAVVPSEPGLDLKRAFESWERSEDDALLPFVPQRSFLLFGMLLRRCARAYTIEMNAFPSTWSFGSPSRKRTCKAVLQGWQSPWKRLQ